MRGNRGVLIRSPLPSRIYSIGKEVDSIQSPSSLQSFFDELDSLGAGKDTVLTIVHLGDSHIQAVIIPVKVSCLLQLQSGMPDVDGCPFQVEQDE